MGGLFWQIFRFSDNLYLANGGDRVFGLDGNATITTSAGENAVNGDDGDDTLNGDSGDDFPRWDDPSNSTYCNVISGGVVRDTIVVNSGTDVVNGGTGDDTVEASSQQSGQIVRGGTGIDLLQIIGVQNDALVTITLSATFQPLVDTVAEATYTGFERLAFVGGAGAEDITCGAGDDSFTVNDSYTADFAAGAIDRLGGNNSFDLGGVTNAGIHQVSGGNGTDLPASRKGNLQSLNLLLMRRWAPCPHPADSSCRSVPSKRCALCPQTWQATLSTLASAGFNLSLADGGPGNDTLTRLASFINAVTSSGEINGRGGIDKLTLNFKIVNQTITSDLSPGSVTLYDGFTVTGCETVD